MRRLAVLVATLVAVAGLASCSRGGHYDVTATFDDVGDLVTGHAVQVADVRVGRIAAIHLTDDYRAEVTLSIDDDTRIPRSARAVLRQTSLLGEKFVELRTDDPDEGPFLEDGDAITETSESPELELITEQAVGVLGAVVGTDVASLVDTGAKGFGGHGDDLRALIDDLSTISATFAQRTDVITAIIDRLGAASHTLAAGDDDLDALLVNLSQATTVLSDNRTKVVTALDQLSRLAAVQDEEVFDEHYDAVDRQVGQLDDILDEIVHATGEVESLIDWLARFGEAVPKGIPGDFAQVYLWAVAAE
jgi:phospholipid/cholesterol/gamma-HCH transport system substrate-binding protein